MAKLRVDFNSVDAEGFVRSRLSRADSPIEVGQVVEAYDDEGAHCKAAVASVDPERGTVRILLDRATWWNEPRVLLRVDPRLGLMNRSTLILFPTAVGTVTTANVSCHAAAS
jgi:hypothetical protein